MAGAGLASETTPVPPPPSANPAEQAARTAKILKQGAQQAGASPTEAVAVAIKTVTAATESDQANKGD